MTIVITIGLDIGQHQCYIMVVLQNFLVLARELMFGYNMDGANEGLLGVDTSTQVIRLLSCNLELYNIHMLS